MLTFHPILYRKHQMVTVLGYEEHKESSGRSSSGSLLGHSVRHGVGNNGDGATDTDSTVLIQETDLNLDYRISHGWLDRCRTGSLLNPRESN